MKISYKILFLITLISMLISCKKDTVLDGSKAIERSNRLEKDLISKLQNAPEGWVLMVPSLSKDIITATPILLKFDVITNKVSFRSPFRAGEPDSYFSISASIGLPLLTFSTKSIISDMYEQGQSTITDYFFKVLKVGDDVIEIQPYRKGKTFRSEGGEIMKMVRNPVWLKDWNQSPKSIYRLRNNSTIKLEYTDGTPPAFQSIILYTPYSWGDNSLDFDGSGTPPFKTTYFLIRKETDTKMDIFAIDKDGKEIITGSVIKN